MAKGGGAAPVRFEAESLALMDQHVPRAEATALVEDLPHRGGGRHIAAKEAVADPDVLHGEGRPWRRQSAEGVRDVGRGPG